ncbi:MAG: hydroxyethylthiazole kinase [Pseudorhodoplanes sp.]
MHAPPGHWPDLAADLLERLRENNPRVHCITNNVAQTFTANALLATGAIPSMTISPDEIAAFASRADALLVNLGTFDVERQTASDAAIPQVKRLDRPWVLDPVLIDRSPPRADYARELADRGPAAVRLNAGEFEALDGTSSIEDYAGNRDTVLALTGAVDLITNGPNVVRIRNGHPLMARVTAMGCAEGAFIAATLAVEPDRFAAVVSAVLIFGIAGDIAGEKANGPGSFGVHFVDALFSLDREAIRARAKIS